MFPDALIPGAISLVFIAFVLRRPEWFVVALLTLLELFRGFLVFAGLAYIGWTIFTEFKDTRPNNLDTLLFMMVVMAAIVVAIASRLDAVMVLIASIVCAVLIGLRLVLGLSSQEFVNHTVLLMISIACFTVSWTAASQHGAQPMLRLGDNWQLRVDDVLARAARSREGKGKDTKI